MLSGAKSACRFAESRPCRSDSTAVPFTLPFNKAGGTAPKLNLSRAKCLASKSTSMVWISPSTPERTILAKPFTPVLSGKTISISPSCKTNGLSRSSQSVEFRCEFCPCACTKRSKPDCSCRGVACKLRRSKSKGTGVLIGHTPLPSVRSSRTLAATDLRVSTSHCPLNTISCLASRRLAGLAAKLAPVLKVSTKAIRRSTIAWLKLKSLNTPLDWICLPWASLASCVICAVRPLGVVNCRRAGPTCQMAGKRVALIVKGTLAAAFSAPLGWTAASEVVGVLALGSKSCSAV